MKQPTTRKKAAEELYKLVRCYEKVSLTTVYKKCFYDRRTATWRYIGRAYDYSY